MANATTLAMEEEQRIRTKFENFFDKILIMEQELNLLKTKSNLQSTPVI